MGFFASIVMIFLHAVSMRYDYSFAHVAVCAKVIFRFGHYSMSWLNYYTTNTSNENEQTRADANDNLLKAP